MGTGKENGTMTITTYIITILSIIATFANSMKKRWSFHIWLVTNSFWCIYNWSKQEYAQALLFGVYIAIAINGLRKWRHI